MTSVWVNAGAVIIATEGEDVKEMWHTSSRLHLWGEKKKGVILEIWVMWCIVVITNFENTISRREIFGLFGGMEVLISVLSLLNCFGICAWWTCSRHLDIGIERLLEINICESPVRRFIEIIEVVDIPSDFVLCVKYFRPEENKQPCIYYSNVSNVNILS